jgi:hypothetical protein
MQDWEGLRLRRNGCNWMTKLTFAAKSLTPLAISELYGIGEELDCP